MKYHPADAEEDQRRLEELLDRMLKAGWIVRHGHTQERLAATLSLEGERLAATFQALESELGPLDGRDRILLWHWFRLAEIGPDGAPPRR